MEKKEEQFVWITCPHCGNRKKFKKPSKLGIYKFQCTNPECGKAFSVPYGVKINNKPEEKKGEEKANPDTPPQEQVHRPTDYAYNKKTPLLALIQKRRFLRNKVYRLSVGENTIGRKDYSQPSGIMIDSDDSISRKSIAIYVSHNDGRYEFLLKILKALNPVMVNGKEIPVGNSIYLQEGDTILLGKTMFYLGKEK